MDAPGWRPLLLHGAKQGLADQPGGHSLSHRITHYFTGKHILEACQIEPALVGSDIGDITGPDFVGFGGRKNLAKDIYRHRQGMGGMGRRLEFTLLFARQPHFAAQPPNPVTPGVKSFSGQLGLQS
uniref:Integrase catalytic region n=1 Tax=Aeromonas hydrophila TaxID=644 RepID=A0A068CIY2_AERHY|nr:integrase catalytic region [Aeromonas hydrophila]AID21758.1 integrase catalytic region [Aeromonas hydrophila]